MARFRACLTHRSPPLPLLVKIAAHDATALLHEDIEAAGLQIGHPLPAGADDLRLPSLDHGDARTFLWHHRLLDRELYVPKTWTDDPSRCRQAGIPENRRFATKPQLAQQMLQRAPASSVPARWVTNDSVYGDDWRLLGVVIERRSNIRRMKEEDAHGGRDRDWNAIAIV